MFLVIDENMSLYIQNKTRQGWFVVGSFIFLSTIKLQKQLSYALHCETLTKRRKI